MRGRETGQDRWQYTIEGIDINIYNSWSVQYKDQHIITHSYTHYIREVRHKSAYGNQ
jgi:hypothetical protein